MAWIGKAYIMTNCFSLRERIIPQMSDGSLGQQGPPAQLDEVSVEPPIHNLTPDEVPALDNTIQQWYQFSDDASRIYLWIQGLGWARVRPGN